MRDEPKCPKRRKLYRLCGWMRSKGGWHPKTIQFKVLNHVAPGRRIHWADVWKDERLVELATVYLYQMQQWILEKNRKAEAERIAENRRKKVERMVQE